MKNILIAALIFVANYGTAQVYVNNIDVNKFDYAYVEMWEHYNKQNGKYYALVDYGQVTTTTSNRENFRVNHLNGGPMEFNSIVSILNFLHKNGWELVSIKTTGEIDSYIMKRISEMPKADNKEATTVENKTPAENKTEEGNNNNQK